MNTETKAISIALMGRPNVGKSSLFNALLGHRRAIVLDLPGTTRDIIEEVPSWSPKKDAKGHLTILDSQGIWSEDDEDKLDEIIARANVFLFVVDAAAGITPFDRWIATRLKQSGKRTLLILNKIDKPKPYGEAEFAMLGFAEMISTSAAHRWEIEGLRDWCVAAAGGRLLTPEEEAVAALAAGDEEETLSVVFLGRPNSGKSTLTNRLAGKQISLVSPEPLTTRDPVAFEMLSRLGKVRVLDTAGVRRPRSKKEDLEVFSIQASIRSIHQADIVFLLIPSHEGISDQDMRLLNLIEKEGKNPVILLNFWDKFNAEQKRDFLPNMEFLEVLRPYKILPISGKSGYNVNRIIPLAFEITATSKMRVRTSKLNRFVEILKTNNPPPARGKASFNIMYASQVRVEPPTFVFFMNRKANLPESYQKYVENSLRKKLGFKNQNIRVFFRASENRPERAERFGH